VTTGEDGEEVPLDLAELVGGLERSPSSARPSPPTEPSPEAAEGAPILDPANHGSLVPEHLRDGPTSAALRDEVLARDGFRCRSCGSKRNLSVHHRVWRSHGGRTVRENLLCACEACHSLIHARLLIVLGDPEGTLTFLDRLGRPIERVPGKEPTDLFIERDCVPVADAGGRVDTARLVELERLPAEVDADWWARHQHLFTWNERQGDLLLTPGCAVEAAPLPSPTLPAATTDGSGFSSLVGQSATRARLEVAIAAARGRGEPPGHLLFAGSPGLGKTSFARAVASEVGAPFARVAAPLVRAPDTLVRVLASLGAGSVLFLDELHALPVRSAEALYEALDTGALSLTIRQGLRARTVRLLLRPFTLIGATTEAGRLPGPLLSRLRVFHLEAYGPDELIQIVTRAARADALALTAAGAERLALASRATPRRALALLAAVRDEAAVVGAAVADAALVERTLAREGVDAEGLDRIERAYVRELERAGRAVGLTTLADRLGVSEHELQTVHEPHLIRLGLVRVTSAGRVLERRVGPERPNTCAA
jgi:Holliday junction DNA helicase RuvB